MFKNSNLHIYLYKYKIRRKSKQLSQCTIGFNYKRSMVFG